MPAKNRAPKPNNSEAAWLRAVVDTAVDGIIVINAEGIVQMFNQACERIFGYPAEEVIGQNVKMLMPAVLSRKHDDYLAHYLAPASARSSASAARSSAGARTERPSRWSFRSARRTRPGDLSSSASSAT